MGDSCQVHAIQKIYVNCQFVILTLQVLQLFYRVHSINGRAQRPGGSIIFRRPHHIHVTKILDY